MSRDASGATMTDRPVLFASYSGVLGGAERVLLDCVTRLEPPVDGRLPGRAAGRRRCEAGVAHVPVAARPLQARPAHTGRARRAGAATSRRLDPAFVVAWGARAVLAAALMPRAAAVARRPPRPAARPRDPRGRARRATRRADGIAAASHAIAAQLGGRRSPCCTRASTSTRFTPAPAAGRPAPRARARRAGRVEAARARARDRRAAARSCRLTLAGAPLPGDDDRSTQPSSAPAPNVTFAGPIADVPPRWPSAHVLLHCADAEPYGLVAGRGAGRRPPGRRARRGGPAGDRHATARAACTRRATRDAAAARAATRRSPTRTRPRPRARRAEALRRRDDVRRSGTRSTRATRRPHRAAERVSYAVVVVLHESRAELAALLDHARARRSCRRRHRPRRRRRRTRATRTAPR